MSNNEHNFMGIASLYFMIYRTQEGSPKKDSLEGNESFLLWLCENTYDFSRITVI